MGNFKSIFKFGWPYLKRYRMRLVTGILLGFLFGVSNASFLWATKTIFTRLSPPTEQTVATTKPDTSPVPSSFIARVKYSARQFGQKLQKDLQTDLDPWLPLQGRKLDWRQALGGFLLLPVLVFFRGAIGYLSTYCMSWVSERVIKDLRLDLLAKLSTLSMDFYNRSTLGDLLGRVNGDTQALYRCMSMGFSDLITEPITVISLGFGLLYMDWKLTILSVMFIPTIIIPIRVLSRKSKKAFTSSVSAGVSQDSLLVEVFSSIRIVKAFCLEPFQMKRFRSIYESLVHIGMKGVQSRELVNPIIEVISVLGLGFVIVFIFYSHRTIPNMAGFLTGVLLLFTPVKRLGALPVLFQQARVGSERLIAIFDLQPTVREKPNPVPLTEFRRGVTFENVTFAYGNKSPALRDFTLVVPRGFKLGIAGESGSGKSTFINLLFRFYDPVSGSIKFDGHDLRDVSVNDLRHMLALVSQEIVLFDQTVAENIAMGRPGGVATQAEIEAAAKASYAHDFIMRLPNGYNTKIGETGKLLSGGQRQRIAIARAFIRNAPILVLDEATGNLDSNAEGEVQAAIERLARERTVICVAHRLSTLMKMDEIIVLADGRIVEQGSFEEL
ncbi:MAG TPA: ABC transporter ATP-binding protein, partial [Verrucomicrobiae bacterium]|nr:ABC transporter ATP-binding protein [Verrucomicrobiae bacterium]